MKNSNTLVFYLKVVVLAVLCITLTQLNSTTLVDFTKTDRKGGSGITIPAPTITCDVNQSWTCTFVGTATPDTDTYRYVDSVALAHINLDGSIYLQEIGSGSDTSMYTSVTLPAWYVSNGLTSYTMAGTNCKFTIKPTITAGTATDWTLTVKASGAGANAACDSGGTDKAGAKGKSGKEKTGTSAKGPGPK